MWPCYVINLEQDKNRRDRIATELASADIGWRRLPAIDGRLLAKEELHRHYDAAAARHSARYPLVPSEIGCYLSHRSAWQTLLDSGEAGGIVLEDDFRLTGDLKAVIEALSVDEGEWDIVKLFSFKPVAFLGSARSLTETVVIGTPRRVPSTTLGYAITARGAKAALEASESFFRPIDEDHKFYWEMGLRIAAVSPSPISVGVQETAAETIGQERRRAGRDHARSAIGQAWINLRYRLRYQAGLWRSRHRP